MLFAHDVDLATAQWEVEPRGALVLLHLPLEGIDVADQLLAGGELHDRLAK